jgi:hypothetical protein
MKKFNLIPVFFAVIMAVFFFASCEKEVMTDVVTETNNSEILPTDNTVAKYQKEVTLKDVTGKNTVKLLISADKQEILDRYDNNSFNLNPLFDKPNKPSEEIVEEVDTPPNTIASTPPTDTDEYKEENAVHIQLMEKQLASDAKGFNLEVNNEKIGAGKTDNYGYYNGGPYYFYSWVADHYFYITPNNSSGTNSVSAWFYWIYNGACCWGSAYRYRYMNSYWNTEIQSSTDNGIDMRMRAQGTNFYVYWY